jgi:hypothetical protein
MMLPVSYERTVKVLTRNSFLEIPVFLASVFTVSATSFETLKVKIGI